MKKRVKLGQQQSRELLEAYRWCLANDMHGFAEWYELELNAQYERRALTPDVAAEFMGRSGGGEPGPDVR